MRLDSDKILAMNGIGPKSFEEIKTLTDALRITPEEAAALAAAAAEAEAAAQAESDAGEMAQELAEEAVEEAEAEPVAEGAEAELAAVATPEEFAEEAIAEPEAEIVEEPEVEEAVAEPEPEKPVAKKAPAKEPEEEKEADEFDKLFSYDARKYGYYEDENPDLLKRIQPLIVPNLEPRRKRVRRNVGPTSMNRMDGKTGRQVMRSD